MIPGYDLDGPLPSPEPHVPVYLYIYTNTHVTPFPWIYRFVCLKFKRLILFEKSVILVVDVLYLSC